MTKESGMSNLPRQNRSLTMLWSAIASLILNTVVIGGFLVTAQVSYMRASADRLLAQMRRELTNYRMILLLPAANLSKPPPASMPKSTSRTRTPKKSVPPLAIPDERILREMDPRITKFIRDNPGIESIFTREIVRDVDSGVLDLRKLLVKSKLRIRCGVDDSGHTGRPKIEVSSGVASIDHLGLELIKLLDKYSLLTILKGVTGIVVSIEVEEQVSVNLKTVLEPATQPDSVRNQIQGMLALLRFTLPQEEGAFFLNDLSLTVGEHDVILSKDFEKPDLAAFLKRYYQPSQPN